MNNNDSKNYYDDSSNDDSGQLHSPSAASLAQYNSMDAAALLVLMLGGSQEMNRTRFIYSNPSNKSQHRAIINEKIEIARLGFASRRTLSSKRGPRVAPCPFFPPFKIKKSDKGRQHPTIHSPFPTLDAWSRLALGWTVFIF